ncbi:MAG: hypothetical protein KAW12_09580 [Candidatus Aminicenantes bacterium]|nr:hypothetical protein [Candidatus Aminicenantes bacterium]
MDIWEIDEKLPNGLHDALIHNISIDYVQRELKFDMEIHVGDPEAPTEAEREAYKNARLKLKGFHYCVIEPPDQNYPFLKKEPLWIDLGNMEKLRSSSKVTLPDNIPEDAFTFRIFVVDWNSFIYVSATEAEFSWI